MVRCDRCHEQEFDVFMYDESNNRQKLCFNCYEDIINESKCDNCLDNTPIYMFHPTIGNVCLDCYYGLLGDLIEEAPE